MLDLHTCDPGFRIDDSTPFDLLDAAEKLPAWDEHSLAVADTLLNAWCVRACMHEDREGTSALSTTLRALLDRLPHSQQIPPAWRARWQAYLDLLAGRSLCFTSDQEIDTLRSRQHVDNLLRALPPDGSFMAQSKLKQELELGNKFSDSRLSQLLGQIADHGLIAPRRQGKCKEWQLTERGRALFPDAKPQFARPETSSGRGTDAFVIKKAA